MLEDAWPEEIRPTEEMELLSSTKEWDSSVLGNKGFRICKTVPELIPYFMQNAPSERMSIISDMALK